MEKTREAPLKRRLKKPDTLQAHHTRLLLNPILSGIDIEQHFDWRTQRQGRAYTVDEIRYMNQ